jgi:YbbR domain-containing protein
MKANRFWLLGLQFAIFFVLALFIWVAIESEQTSIVQRALEVPLSTTGLGENRVAIGVPERVVVVVSGPSNDVERLRPEYFDAFIDLRGVEHDFNVTVRTNTFGNVDIVDITPASIIGIIEALDARSVPVRVFFNGESVVDGLHYRHPEEALVSGQETLVAQVAYVGALVEGVADEETGEVSSPLFAVGVNDLPVGDVTIIPAEVSIAIEREEVLYSRRLPVEVVLPDPSPLVVTGSEASSAELRVAGPRDLVDSLERVEMVANLAGLSAGSHTLELEPRLPEGVFALEPLTVRVDLEAPDGAGDGTEGDTGDTSR